MSQQIYINGEFLSRDDAKISVYDHGLLYGDGIVEGEEGYRRVAGLKVNLLSFYPCIAMAFPNAEMWGCPGLMEWLPEIESTHR